ncbi:hypothetical protein AVEN_26396-1 [Araneus ventricosus]|uniref:Uncharacterized protein n=1 Tax=Araneus ventricosus TaxID=182803 RepID=A0A4Y2Q035_ARAVE|nr:hypothetical protein AVEN_26396-1 [Araneus ventricosus]
MSSGHHFHAGGRTSSHLSLCEAIAKTAFNRCKSDQPSFSNSMTSSFARCHPLRLMIVGFLEGHNIYRKGPESLPDLKDSIRRHVLDIPADSLRSAVENMVLRLEHIVEHEGGHIEQF